MVLECKRLNIPHKNVCELLQAHCKVVAVANELNCRQGLRSTYEKAKKIVGGIDFIQV